MHERIAQVVVLIALIVGSQAAEAAQKRRPAAKRPVRAAAPTLKCGNVLGFQILLDRTGFSPGQIDGKVGANLTHTVTALQTARKLHASGQLDCETWRALGGDQAGDLLAPYTLTDDDVHAAYVKDIPKDLVEQANLPSLGYGSMIERLGERFHASPTLLEQLNAGAAFDAGSTIKVPAVKPFDAGVKPPADPLATGDLTIVVTKSDSALRVTKPDGSIAFFAPVTTGSEHDPLPEGNWKVTGVQWNPTFHYNPDLFWDAKPDQTRAIIKPGPNNPVGVVWIDLDLEHYGLHGTPEPGNVGHTASHGCVRLTNWDAARVATFVKPGTAVQFR